MTNLTLRPRAKCLLCFMIYPIKTKIYACIVFFVGATGSFWLGKITIVNFDMMCMKSWDAFLSYYMCCLHSACWQFLVAEVKGQIFFKAYCWNCCTFCTRGSKGTGWVVFWTYFYYYLHLILLNTSVRSWLESLYSFLLHYHHRRLVPIMLVSATWIIFCHSSLSWVKFSDRCTSDLSLLRPSMSPLGFLFSLMHYQHA